MDQVRSSYRLMKELTVNNEVYVELGNEVYNKSDPALRCIFPEPESYRDRVNEYLEKLHSPTEFPGINVKVGVVASSPSVKDKALTLDCHFTTWNSELGLPYSGTSSDQLNLQDGDALIYHIYPLSDAAEATGSGLPTISYLDPFFSLIFNTIDEMKENEFKSVPPGIKAWITEYNYSDKVSTYILGTWAHALYTVVQALRFLESPKVDKVVCHDLFNNGGRSSLFSSNVGFDVFSDCEKLKTLPTAQFKKTGQGYALTMLGKVFKGSINTTEIDFSGVSGYSFTNAPGRKQIYGWLMEKADGANNTIHEAIIVNMGNTDITIDANAIFDFDGNLSYEILSNNDPLVYVTSMKNGNETEYGAQKISDCDGTITNDKIDYTPLTLANASSITIPKYGLVRIQEHPFDSNAKPALFKGATSNVCKSEKFNLFAYGAPNFVWSTTSMNIQMYDDEGNQLANDGGDYRGSSIVVQISNTNGSTITVQGRDAADLNNVGSAPASVNIAGHALPPQFVITSGDLTACAKSLTPTSSGDYYLWSPASGIITGNVTDSYIEVQPFANTHYTLTEITDDGCWRENSKDVNYDVANQLSITSTDHPNFKLCGAEGLDLVANNGTQPFRWRDGIVDITTSTATYPDYDPSVSTTMFLTASTGCYAGAIQLIEVNPEFNNFQRNFSACVNDCIKLSIDTKKKNVEYKFDWENAEVTGVISTDPPPVTGWNKNMFCNASIDDEKNVAGFTPDIADVFTIRVDVWDSEDPDCISVAEFIVTATDPPTVTVSPAAPTFCEGGYGALTLSADQDCDFFWQNGSDLDQVNGDQIMVKSSQSSVTYTYVAINEGGCCLTQDVDVESVPCCDSNEGLTYQNPTPLTLLYNLVLKGYDADWNTGVIDFAASADNIAINGDFPIDRNVTFKNIPNLTFNDGGSAIVQSSVTLTLDNSEAEDCDGTLWSGFSATSSTAKIVTKTNASLRNSVNGLASTNDAKLEVDQTTFTDNYVDISIGATTVASTFFIRNSQFISTGNLLPPYNAQKKEAAVDLTGVSTLTIGGTDIGNTFTSGLNGIRATNSTINIYGNAFQNFGNGAPAIRSSGASGITAIGSTGINPGNDFINSTLAVYGTNGKFTVRGNTFTTVNTGVKIQNCTNKDIDITGNTISNTNTAIWTVNNSGSDIVVQGNTITLNTATGPTPVITGIQISESNQNTNMLANVNNNIINGGGINGISLSNTKNALLIDNEITITTVSSVTQNGILFSNSKDATLNCNQIYGSTYGGTNDKKRAFSFSQSTGNKIEANTTDKTLYAIEVLGVCDNMKVLSDIFYQHATAIQLGTTAAASMSNQVAANYDGVAGIENPGSEFYGDGTGYFDLDGLNSNANSDQTDFYHNSGFPHTPSFPVTSQLKGVLNNANPAYTSLACFQTEGKMSSKNFVLSHRKNNNGNQFKLTGDSIAELFHWSQDKCLFEQLEKDLSLLNSDSTLAEFHNEKLISNIGLFTNEEKLISSAIDTFGDVITLDKDIFSDALTLNDNLSPEFIFEENLQALYRIYILNLQEQLDNYSTDEKFTIEDIANQCPSEGGPAVYMARAMKEQYDSITYYDDECDDKQDRPGSESASKTENRLLLFPNPSADMVYASYDGQTDESTYIRISDAAQRILILQGISMFSDIIPLNTGGLPSGIYMCDLLQNSKLLARSKLIIIK